MDQSLSIVVFDTDILIDAGRGIVDALSAIEHAETQFIAAVSAITQMELMVGCRNRSELRILDRFLARFRILPLDVMI